VIGPVLEVGSRAVIVGFGVTGRAMAAALVRRGFSVGVTDDFPYAETTAAAAALGVDLLGAPDETALRELLAGADALLPTPGLPDRHPVFAIAADIGVPVISELDLARMWDARPIVAITGTDGKTTVTTLVTEMLRVDGRSAEAVGNTDVPLVHAIDDPDTEVFVVEASSFRLGHSAAFAPDVATWLNFDADHLEVHASLGSYEAAKAKIWRDQLPSQTAVANADDPVVMANFTGAAQKRTFGLARGDNRVVDGRLIVDECPLLDVEALPRHQPHDLSNALAAATTAMAAGVGRDAIAEVLRSFTGLPHRVALVGIANGVSWYDDSKATTPHAAISAVSGFESAILIAGGRNKGIDLRRLAEVADHLRHVVAIGESAAEVVAAFAGRVPTSIAEDMESAVRTAAGLAQPDDVVLLSPACASFDWYRNYGERGDDFARLARELVLERS